MRVDAIEKQLPRPVETLSSKNKRHKGRQPTSILTINGRVTLSRIWWHSPIEGSSAPLDLFIRADGATTTPGVREMACRVNNHSSSFTHAAENLQRTAQVTLCDESLRQIVLKEGPRVQADQRSGRLVPSFTAEDCRIDNAYKDVSDKSRSGVGFSPRFSGNNGVAWAKAHPTTTFVGHVKTAINGTNIGQTSDP